MVDLIAHMATVDKVRAEVVVMRAAVATAAVRLAQNSPQVSASAGLGQVGSAYGGMQQLHVRSWSMCQTTRFNMMHAML